MPLVVTKLDLPAARERWPEVRAAFKADGADPIAVSAHDGTGLEALRKVLAAALDAAEEAEAAADPRDVEMRIHRFDPLAEGWQVVPEDGGFRVRGRRIETAAARTDFENDESRDRFWRMLERLGIDQALRDEGAGPGVTVHIGPAELEWGDEE